MTKGSQGNEEDPIILSKDPKIEGFLRDASNKVGNDLAELIKIIQDSKGNCKSSTSESSDNRNVTDSQGVPNFLAKEGDKLITLLTENIKEHLSTCFQQPNDKGKGVSAENSDKNDSRQQQQGHSQTIPDLSMRMRYNVLGPLLQPCLLFLSVFLENEFIKKRSLIYWWIGEGWVRPSESKTAEQVGEECFKMLLLSGLIQPVFKKHDKHARGCEINPSVKNMLISIAADDNFFAFDSQNKQNVNTEKCKRAFLVENKKDQVVEVDPKSNNLLSLFNVNARYLACAKNKFSSLESIVALQLGRWQSTPEHHIEIEDTKFLDNLGVMKNLRYLNLQGISKITKLPDSCGQLTKLQILDLRGCHHLERLPNEISLLKNLTHLDLSECHFLERMPKVVSGLLELQVLKGFVLNNDGVDGSCGLNELTELKKLRKLSIKVLAPIDMNELKKISSLHSLTICWAKIDVLSSLAFPPDVEKLDLQRIPQSGLPDSLRPENLKNLKKLYIRGGKLKSLNLSTETDKWNVEILRLRFLKDLELHNWSEIEKAFPSLSFIEIHKCQKLEENSALIPPLNYEGEDLIMRKKLK